MNRVEAQNFVRLIDQNKNRSYYFLRPVTLSLSCYGSYHHLACCMSGELERQTLSRKRV
jgi:hypothetical protein